MRMSSTRTALTAYLTPEERDRLIEFWGSGVMLSYKWDAAARTIVVEPAPPSQHAARSSIRIGYTRLGQREQQWIMAWCLGKGELASDKHAPRFALTEVSLGFSDPPSKKLTIMLPPADRLDAPPDIYRVRGRPTAPKAPAPKAPQQQQLPLPPAAPSNGGTIKLDLLDALRYHRDKLNEVKARHPEIGFIVRPDGRLAVELLLEE